MAEQYSHINYTLADIERYLHGGMSAKEMHDVEKAALQDPFLADAIEGFSEAPLQQAKDHLNQVAAFLQQPAKEEAKLIELPAGRNIKWMRAAAMIAGIAGVGIISLYLLNQSRDDQKATLAQEKVEIPIKADTIRPAEQTATVTLDSNFRKKDAPVILPLSAKETDNSNQPADTRRLRSETEAKKEAFTFRDHKNEDVASKAVTESVPQSVPATQSDTLVNGYAVIDNKQLADKAPQQTGAQTLKGLVAGVSVESNYNTKKKVQVNAQQYMEANNKLQFVLNGRIIDDNNLAVPNATIKLKNSNTATITDINGNFNFKTPDSIATVTISSVGYETASVQLKNNTSNKIVLNEAGESLAETIIIGMDAKKKKLAAADETIKDTSSAVRPETGWNSFEEYVYKKLNKEYDSTADLANVTGDVELEFQVDKKGRPYNVTVTRSLTGDADDKAVKLLQNGPKWITDSKKKKGKVTIHFEQN